MPWILHGICLCVKPDRDVWPICGLAFCRAEWGGMSRQLTKEHVDLGDRVRAARINAGLSQEEAAYRLLCGHESMDTARIYAAVSAERRRAAVARIA